MCLRCNTIQFT